ncbi:MAG TPA: hypothetical protein VIL34_08180 [Actinopolymorphaceae bacterium]
MRWLWLFGGIALVVTVVYVLLGIWLWRRAKALYIEVDTSLRKLEAALPESELAAGAAEPRGLLPAGARVRSERQAGDGHRS